MEDGAEVETANNPRDADTDNNGVEDGEENAGTISSFDSGTGMLVIDFGNGHTVSGLVTSATRIECRAREEQEAENENDENEANDARAADHGGSDDGDRSGSDNSGPGTSNSGPGDGNEEGTTCGT